MLCLPGSQRLPQCEQPHHAATALAPEPQLAEFAQQLLIEFFQLIQLLLEFVQLVVEPGQRVLLCRGQSPVGVLPRLEFARGQPPARRQHREPVRG